DDPDLGAAQTRETGALSQRQIDVVRRVNDVGRGVQRVLGVDADWAVRPGQRKQRSDDDFFRSLSKSRTYFDGERRGAGGQQLSAIHGRAPLRETSAAAPAPLLPATQDSRGRPIDLAFLCSVIADALAR